MRYAIVGGGLLGLATAHTILREVPGAEVVVLERGAGLAEGQTGHTAASSTPGSTTRRGR